MTAVTARGSTEPYPDLPLESWRDTKETLHRFSQIIGKLRLASSYPRNHWWDVPLYVTARGVTTSPMHHGERNGLRSSTRAAGILSTWSPVFWPIAGVPGDLEVLEAFFSSRGSESKSAFRQVLLVRNLTDERLPSDDRRCEEPGVGQG